MTETSMPQTRVVLDESVMGGMPCLRGTRVPVATVLAALAEHLDPGGVLADFPQLTREDLSAALSYAAAASGLAADTVPRWSRMMVGQLLDTLDEQGHVIGLVDRDGAARAFLLKATPDVVRVIEDLTMRADVPPART
jgi:uncharacterized protein (DUF433 family)